MSIIEFFSLGGPVMWPILACSVIALAVFIERLWVIKEKRHIEPSFIRAITHLLEQKNTDQAETLCAQNGSTFAEIVHTGLKNRERNREEIKTLMEETGRLRISGLERYVNIIGIVATIAPLLGLLGTVTGMLKVFRNIAQYENPSIGVLAEGIYEALITTAFGLPVGIIAYICYGYIMSKIDKLALLLEEESLSVLNIIDKLFNNKTAQ